MRNFSKILILIIVLTGISVSKSNALPPGPPGGGGGPACWPPPCSPIPIDGGLSYILIAGLAFGGKKVYDLNKKQ